MQLWFSSKELDAVNDQSEVAEESSAPTEKELRRRSHVCWFTREEEYQITLHEVVERTYRHPDTDELLVSRMETKYIDSASKSSNKASTWVLLSLNMRAVTQAVEAGG